ncbi:Hypothetical predicted protein [Olea europaea subsp. europaea]|uniref:DUF3741 domain-containing protein n=1 Tax=Olea europaea subsp. europaea TaxID=158383 RepID=A0A8S0UYQ9_OLEEU|nr:Hypothetical predicted protein [Olea europaea subsp. europaea]
MASKSDFAQKLLHDLRLRKERMAATQNSGQHSNQMSTATYVNRGQTYSGGRQIKASQSASSKTGNTFRKSNAGSRAISTDESSKQIVLSDRGHGSRQAGDLSTAIAFALENGGKLKITSSSNNPLVNFFNRFGRRSVDTGKMKISNKQGLSTNQFPTVSHIHITEISKGIQKLNQILRACSNGHNFDRNSIQVGKELLKGAMDLEESLKMLVNLQEASEYMISPQQKSRIKLLDEDEDDEDNNDNIVDKRILDRPRFSFDKHDKNSYVSRDFSQNDFTQQLMVLTYPAESPKQLLSSSKIAPHKRSASCVPDFDSRSAYVKPKIHPGSPQCTQDKGRMSNVIAKLMGLEELPQKEDSKCVQKDSSQKKKEGKISNKNSKLPQPLDRDGKNGSPLSTNKKLIQTNHAPATRDAKFDVEIEKNQVTSSGKSETVISGKNPPRQDMKIQAVGVDAQSGPKTETIAMNKQRNRISEPNQVPGFQNFQESKTQENVTKYRERKMTDTRGSNSISNTELQQKPQQKVRKPEAEIAQENIESKVIVDHLPKSSANEVLQSNPQKLQDDQELHQVPVPTKPDRSENKSQAEKSGQQLLKQNLQPKNLKGHQVERMIASKPKSKVTSLQKKQSNAKATPANRKSIKQLEKVSLKDSPNSRQQYDSRITASYNSTVNLKISMNDLQSENSSTKELENEMQKEGGSSPLLAKEKPMDVVATQKAVQIRRNEKHPKIDVVMTRRNGMGNHSTRPLKHSTVMVRVKQQKPDQLKEEEVAIIRCKDSERINEPLKESDKLQNDAGQTTILNNSVADECQTQKSLDMLTPNDRCQDLAPKSVKVIDDYQSGDQPYAFTEAHEFKECIQSTGVREAGLELRNFSQHEYKKSPASQDQLTESEKYLKVMLIKSQSFLNAAETLYKLDLAESFIRAGDHNGEDANMKLMLDCGYEVMKRKAWRQEVTVHPYTTTSISHPKVRSFDDLVKQLYKDFEMLKIYVDNGNDECDVADYLYKMLDRDIHNRDLDVNSAWDFGWDDMMFAYPEQDYIIKDVEKHMLNGLLNEITNDLLIVSVSA